MGVYFDVRVAMFKKLTDAAEQFFGQRKTVETTRPSHYRMISVGEGLEGDGKWEVSFFLTGSFTNPMAMSPVSTSKLEALLKNHLPPEHMPEIEHEKTRYTLLTAPDRAKDLASEIVHIFQAEGIAPMEGDYQRFTPKKPAQRAPSA